MLIGLDGGINWIYPQLESCWSNGHLYEIQQHPHFWLLEYHTASYRTSLEKCRKDCPWQRDWNRIHSKTACIPKRWFHPENHFWKWANVFTTTFFIDRRLSLCHLRILTITKCTIMHFLKFLTTEDFWLHQHGRTPQDSWCLW